MEALIETFIGGTGLGLILLFILALFKQFLLIGKPNEVLVFSGRTRKLADGSEVGYREILGGGWTWRWPIIEKVDRMKLTTIPIEIQTTNAYSAGGIPLNVHAVANIKVSSNPSRVKNAIERFMGRDPLEIQRVGKETLEGHLRGVLARLTPEEVNEDRLKFAQELTAEADEDFVKLGLDLDVLKIQNVSDDVEYLDSIGRSRIAEVIRDAEIAESDARSEALQAEAALPSPAMSPPGLGRTIVQKQNRLEARDASRPMSPRRRRKPSAPQPRRERAPRLSFKSLGGRSRSCDFRPTSYCPPRPSARRPSSTPKGRRPTPRKRGARRPRSSR